MELGLLLIGSFFVLVMVGVPIAVSLGASSLFALWYSDSALDVLAPTIYSSISKYSLLAIPFFILAGLIMEKVGISRRLIHLAETLLGGIRGGLILSTVTVAVFFAAISGSGPATVAALGVILIPAMVRQGYKRGMAGALLSSAGSIGIIIPPSIAFIIYASLAQVSVADLFLAGLIPGLLLAGTFIVCSYLMIRKNKDIVVPRRYSGREKLKAFKDAFWGLLAPVIILGGIYSGIFTPTESAGVAVIYGIFVGVFIYKELSFKRLVEVLVDSASSTASVMYIVAFATVFAYILTTSLLAQDMATGILGLSQEKVLLLLLINAVFLIVGFFIDTISAYFILIPVLLPVALALEIDPVHFGVIATVNLAIGQFTPPVGVNLFVASNAGKVPIRELVRSIVPFILSALVGLMVITFIPELSTWLPSLL